MEKDQVTHRDFVINVYGIKYQKKLYFYAQSCISTCFVDDFTLYETIEEALVQERLMIDEFLDVNIKNDEEKSNILTFLLLFVGDDDFLDYREEMLKLLEYLKNEQNV